jgi:hypothetical protein
MTASALTARRGLGQAAGPDVRSGSVSGNPRAHTPEKAWSGLQAKTPADDLRLDLGGTAEALQNPCCRQARLAQAGIAR